MANRQARLRDNVSQQTSRVILSNRLYSKPVDPEGEWWELWDDIKKMPYYYHTLTNQTRWIHPPASVISLVKIQQEVSDDPYFSCYCSPLVLLAPSKKTLYPYGPLSTTPLSSYMYVCVLTCHVDL